MIELPLGPDTRPGPLSTSNAGLEYEICCDATDRTEWHPDVSRFFGYWLQLAPAGVLPGRQHFDVLDIPKLMPRVWLLDVMRDPLRYRFRFAGTKKVESIGREITGQMFDEAHQHSPGRERTLARLNAIVAGKIATHRKGLIGLEHDKSRYLVENCMVPFARDGVNVDMIGVLSVVFNRQGRAI